MYLIRLVLDRIVHLYRFSLTDLEKRLWLTHTSGLGYGFMGGPLEDLLSPDVLGSRIGVIFPLPQLAHFIAGGQ